MRDPSIPPHPLATGNITRLPGEIGTKEVYVHAAFTSYLKLVMTDAFCTLRLETKYTFPEFFCTDVSAPAQQAH